MKEWVQGLGSGFKVWTPTLMHSVLTQQGHCRENSALTRQSRPDSGLGFQVKVLEIFQGVLSSLGSGRGVQEGDS